MIKRQSEPLYNFLENSYERKIFSETMTTNKFLLVWQYIQFNDKATQAQQRGTDKLATSKELWKNVMLNYQKTFFPQANLTIAEQLFLCCF